MAWVIDRNRPAYVHQINTLKTAKTGTLLEAVERDCVPLFRRHGLKLHAYWESIPGQGPHPETLEIWEMPTIEHYSKFIAAARGPKADPKLAAWFEKRGDWIASTDSMLCLAHPKSPTIADFRRKKTRAKAIMHEMVTTMPSKQLDYLDAIYHLWWKAVAEPGGRELLGLLFSPWNNRRAINIWGMGADWNRTTMLGSGNAFYGDAIQTWMNVGHALREDWNDRLMTPAAFSPVR